WCPRAYGHIQRTGSSLDFRGLGGGAFGVFPGQPDGVDFFGFWLVSVKPLKFGGDDDAAELGGHVGGGRFGLRGVPGRVEAAGLGVGGVVPGGGVPADGDGLAGEHERDGALDRAGGAVAGLAGPEELLRVFYRDFNSPSGCVSFDHPGDARVLFRGDEGQVKPGSGLVADEDDGSRSPFTRGRPFLPVRPGGRSWSAALERSLVVQVTPPGSCFSSSPA